MPLRRRRNNRERFSNSVNRVKRNRRLRNRRRFRNERFTNNGKREKFSEIEGVEKAVVEAEKKIVNTVKNESKKKLFMEF